MRRARSADRPRRDWGRLLSVSEDEVSRRITADVAAGATTLPVDNGGVFGDKGWCQVNGQAVAHTGWDETTEILTLVDPLAAAVEEGDRVALYSHLRGEIVTDLVAEVDRDGVRGEPLLVGVDVALIDSLPLGARPVGEGEDALVEYDPDEEEWTLIRASGLARVSGVKFEADDFYALTADDIAAGQAVIPLTHQPLPGSLVLWWRTVAQEPTEYTVDEAGQTVTLPLASWAAAGDRVWVHYAYRKGLPATDLPIAPTGVSGWSYLQIPLTDSTDRSASDYDDSAWAIGMTAFAGGVATGATAWSLNTGLWLRRAVRASPGSPVTISGMVDNGVEVFWNGVSRGSWTFPNRRPFSVTIPAGDVAQQNVLALRATDDVETSSVDSCYLEVGAQ